MTSTSTDNPIAVWRLLLWLKGTLTFRGYRKDRMKAVNAIVMVLAMAPISIGMAWAVWAFANTLPAMVPMIETGVLGGLYLFWIVTPLLGFAINESYDPTRLFVYPVPYRTIAACAVLGGILDIPTLLMLPLLAVLGAIATHSVVAGLLSALLLATFLFHTLAVSQAIVLALIGLLRSRKFRDMTVVLLPVLGVAFYFAQQSAIRAHDAATWTTFLHSPLLKAVAYLPPGWAASGLAAASAGHYGAAVGWLTALAGALAATLALAGGILRGLYFGDRGEVAVDPPAAFARDADEGGGKSWLAPGVRAMWTKERRYFERDPAYKAAFVQMIYMLVVVVMPWLQMRNNPAVLPGGEVGFIMREVLPFVVATGLTTTFLPITFNILGGEGNAITVLLSLPTPRREVVLGKNLLHALILVPIPAVVIVAVCALLHVSHLAPIGLLWVAIDVATLLGIGNVVSMLLPHRMVVRGQGYQRPGCGYALIQLLAYVVGTVLLCIPAALLAVAVWLHAPLWYAILVPLATLYGAAMYIGGVTLGANLLETRAPEIIGRLTVTE